MGIELRPGSGEGTGNSVDDRDSGRPRKVPFAHWEMSNRVFRALPSIYRRAQTPIQTKISCRRTRADEFANVIWWTVCHSGHEVSAIKGAGKQASAAAVRT